MQFITEEHTGIFQEKLLQPVKMILPGKYSILKQPVDTVNVEGKNDALFKNILQKEVLWLGSVANSNSGTCFAWTKHHSKTHLKVKSFQLSIPRFSLYIKQFLHLKLSFIVCLIKKTKYKNISTMNKYQ